MEFSQLTKEVLRDLPIRKKTLQTYRSIYRCHLELLLGSQQIEDVARADIQGILKLLPPQTAAMTLAVLKTIYREAIARELIEHSPAASIRSAQIQVIPRKFMTIDELEVSDLGKYRVQIMFLAFHGLRWGEAVALTEADIHEERVHVTTAQQLLGHSDPRVTLGVYTQFRDNEIEDDAELMKHSRNK